MSALASPEFYFLQQQLSRLVAGRTLLVSRFHGPGTDRWNAKCSGSLSPKGQNLPTLRRNWAQYHAPKQQSPLPSAAKIGSPSLLAVESSLCGSADLARPVSAGGPEPLLTSPGATRLCPPISVRLGSALQCKPDTWITRSNLNERCGAMRHAMRIQHTSSARHSAGKGHSREGRQTEARAREQRDLEDARNLKPASGRERWRHAYPRRPPANRNCRASFQSRHGHVPGPASRGSQCRRPAPRSRPGAQGKLQRGVPRHAPVTARPSSSLTPKQKPGPGQWAPSNPGASPAPSRASSSDPEPWSHGPRPSP